MTTAGCATTTGHDSSSAVHDVGTPIGKPVGQDADALKHSGTGWFWFHDPALASPVRIAFSVPSVPRTARVLIVMPGALRNADDYLADWLVQPVASSTIVLVPELPKDQFSEDMYNLGGVVDDDGNDQDPSTWTYGFIERLFAQVTQASGSDAVIYDLFGHSAGAQFVHRFVELASHPHLGTAIAANAGWYLMPSDHDSFPYGLDGIPPDEKDLQDAFHSRLVVLLGADDIDEEGELLRHDEGSDAQGLTRLDRGLSFFSRARQTAAEHGFDFAWSMDVVPGVAHDHTMMSRAATNVLSHELD
jgi:hypothetical protein